MGKAGTRPDGADWILAVSRAVLILVGGVLVGSFIHLARDAEISWVDVFAAGVGVLAIAVGGRLSHLRKLTLGPKKAEADFSAELGTTSALNEDQVDEPDERVRVARFLLGSAALAALLDGGGSLDTKLYLYDDSVGKLAPLGLDASSDTSGRTGELWSVGAGATGAAFESGEFTYVEGDAITDHTYGLTAAQAERYRSVTAVAAMPVANLAGDVIGVITATSESSERGELADANTAFDHLLRLADMVARVLVDLFGWFPDQYPDE